jgi:two-component system response regulator WspF
MRIGIVTEVPQDAEVLRQAVTLNPGHHVLWTATSGATAVERCGKETPDLILMDLLAGSDGVDATRRIMTSAPCAILIVTVSVHNNAARVFEAMGHGALDAVDLPATGSLQERAAPLLAKIATISRLIGETDPLRGERWAGARRAPLPHHPLIAIGASAGGPAALASILSGLPKDFPAAIVVVQHVDAQFAGGMADWLSRQSSIPVVVAHEGGQPAVGSVLLAGTSDHLALRTAHRLGYTAEPRHYAYRPSIDVFFESVSRLWQGAAIGVLLTGMGSDGALGLKALRDKGHHTIAQDQASSAVYGMPKAAARLNAAVDILPMERIASRLVDMVVGTRVFS